MDPSQAYAELLALHAEVDRDAGRVAAKNGARLVCKRGCSACCADDLTVFEVEAERLRRNQAQVLLEQPGPVGACAFLDEQGACRVYEDRPYVCRTQGLPLAWFEESPDGEVIQQRTICELNAEGEPLETLDDARIWLIGPAELKLQGLQDGFGDGQQRVALRDLFRG